jgi:hypothetical protein
MVPVHMAALQQSESLLFLLIILDDDALGCVVIVEGIGFPARL